MAFIDNYYTFEELYIITTFLLLAKSYMQPEGHPFLYPFVIFKKVTSKCMYFPRKNILPVTCNGRQNLRMCRYWTGLSSVVYPLLLSDEC